MKQFSNISTNNDCKVPSATIYTYPTINSNNPTNFMPPPQIILPPSTAASGGILYIENVNETRYRKYQKYLLIFFIIWSILLIIMAIYHNYKF